RKRLRECLLDEVLSVRGITGHPKRHGIQACSIGPEHVFGPYTVCGHCHSWLQIVTFKSWPAYVVAPACAGRPSRTVSECAATAGPAAHSRRAAAVWAA